MQKVEREVAGLDVDPICRHEYRLETNALLSDVPLSIRLGALADITNGSQVPFRKAVLVALQDQLIEVQAERHIGHLTVCSSLDEVVVFGVLEQLENTPGIACVEVSG
jgi:hypothetical protein